MNTAAKVKTRAELADDARRIVSRARREGRPLSAAESKKVDSLMATVRGLPDSTLEDGGFASFGEFVWAVASNRDHDSRLKALEVMGMRRGSGRTGGFAVPKLFSSGLRAVDPAEAVIRPRAHIVESDPAAPEADTEVPLLDQGESGFLGGLKIRRIEEGNRPDKTTPRLNLAKLFPAKIGALVEISNDLLRNWRTGGSEIERLFRWALTEQEEFDFLFGNGGTAPLGALSKNSPSLIEVKREVPKSLSLYDLVNMDRAFYGRQGVWLAGRDAHSMLQHIQDGEGKILWPPLGGVVFGKPLIRHDSMPLDGLALVDWTYYAIKDGLGPVVSIGDGKGFEEDHSVLRLLASYDGMPLMTTPIKTRAGATVSPFVMLEGSRPEPPEEPEE